jgi:uncharacterized protein (DUF58 family)
MRGDRRSSRRGTSIEFADYRTYVPGDDLRRVDWNVYARLDRPYLKLLEAEEDLAVYLLVDGSRSMDWGEDSANKFRYSLRLAAALSAVALYSGDRVYVGFLQENRTALSWGPGRGAPSLPRLLAFLETAEAFGQTALNDALTDFLRVPHPPGVVLLISDLFSAGGIESGTRRLQQQGHDIVVLHLLAQDEIDPPLVGELRLIDIETGRHREVSLNPGLHSLYKEHLERWVRGLQSECRRRGIRYVQGTTETTWDRFVLFQLRQAGVLR